MRQWRPGHRYSLAVGVSEYDITNVLLGDPPVNALERVVAAAPELVTALGYDVTDAGRTNDH